MKVSHFFPPLEVLFSSSRLASLSFLLILIGSSALGQAQSSSQLELPITIEFKQKSLFEIWSELEKRYPVQFFFKEEWIPRTKFSGSYQNTPLRLILEEQLTPIGLGYTAWNAQTILIARKAEIEEIEATTYRDLVTQTLNPDQFADLRKQTKKKSNVIGDSTLRPLPTTAILSGRVFESNTDNSLVNASVAFPDLEQGALTDTLGAFELRLPTGYHRTIVKATGRETREFGIWLYSDGEWDVELSFTAFQMEEVLLEAEGAEQNVNRTQAGVVKISPIEMRRMPNLLGEIDVVKSLMFLPGVSSSGEASSGFNVRGGNIDQNLVMQDGNMIFNTSHLLGFFSLFHPDLIKEITLYKGHIPAQFGGRVSSVLDVQLDEGSYRKNRGRLSLGILSSKFSLGGPLKKNRSSYLLGVRAAYPNLVMNFADNLPEVKRSIAAYGDATFKATQKIGELGKLSFTGYASNDVFNFNRQFGYSWQTVMGGLNWKQIYYKGWSSTVQLNHSRYQSSFFTSNDPESFQATSGLSQTQFKAYGLVPTGPHTLQFGLESIWYNIRDNDLEPYGAQSVILPRSVEKDQGLEVGLFVNDEWEINNYLSLDMGLRLSGFSNLGPISYFQYAEGVPREAFTITDTISVGNLQPIKTFGGLEPRLSLKANIDEATSVKVGYNRIHQYSHLLVNSLAATPVDLWQLSNNYFPAQVANSFFFGVYRNFRSNIWQLSLEGYFRDMNGQVINRDFAELLANPHIETEIQEAKGIAYGGEFSLKYDYGKWNVQLSYAYSRSLRRAIGVEGQALVNGGEWFPADIDMPHNITFNGQWKAKRTITYSMNFVYRSGRPISAPVATYGLDPSWFVPAFSERNAYRIRPFHRLDFAATFDRQTIKRNRFKNEVVISVYNFYGRNNPFTVFL